MAAVPSFRLRAGSSVIPTVQEIVERLGGTMTRSAVSFHIDYLARSKLRVREADGEGKADWQREALVTTALRFNIVRRDHLARLPPRRGAVPARILVADGNPVVRAGLLSLLEASGVEVLAEAGDARAAIELTERLRPDLVLLDARMPAADGVAPAEALSTMTRVLMLSHTDDPDVVRQTIRSGAVGYLVHGSFTPDELSSAIGSAIEGRNPLSPAAVSALTAGVRGPRAAVRDPAPGRADGPRPGAGFGLSAREIEVMDLIGDGRSNREIAARLFLSEKTVKNHVNRIYAKLGVAGRAAAIARWTGEASPADPW